MRVLLCFIIISLAQCGSSPEIKTDEKSLSEIVEENNIATQNIVFHIDKSDYILHVEHADSVLKSFPVVFGTDPVGQKLMQGDRKTPEGRFKIRALYPHASWSKFMWIDYPNEQSRLNHDQAKANGEIPEDATIGGEVGIHGVPEGYDGMIARKQNWTWGCISLTRNDVNELYSVCEEGTEILITP